MENIEIPRHEDDVRIVRGDLANVSQYPFKRH